MLRNADLNRPDTDAANRAMFALFVSMLDIFAVKMCMTLTLAFRTANIKSKYVKRKPICDFVFVRNSNVGPICRHSRGNHNRKLHDLDIDL